MPNQRQRIIDANLNRAGEGLHLLEEIARLMLNDAALTQQLKTIRHEILRGDLAFNQTLVQSRDSEGDVGLDIEVAEDKQRELPTIVVANARRVQEALRILEEMAKIPGTTPELDAEKFKQTRFALYTIEQELLSKLTRQDKGAKIAGLYAIIDSQFLGKRDHLKVAEELIKGGANVIQLRDKSTPKAELLPIAQKLQKLCAEKDVLFIINDHLDIALACEADGLHLGQGDLPISEVRRLLPIDVILGCSVNTVEQAEKAEEKEETTSEVEKEDEVEKKSQSPEREIPVILSENLEIKRRLLQFSKERSIYAFKLYQISEKIKKKGGGLKKWPQVKEHQDKIIALNQKMSAYRRFLEENQPKIVNLYRKTGDLKGKLLILEKEFKRGDTSHSLRARKSALEKEYMETARVLGEEIKKYKTYLQILKDKLEKKRKNLKRKRIIQKSYEKKSLLYKHMSTCYPLIL